MGTSDLIQFITEKAERRDFLQKQREVIEAEIKEINAFVTPMLAEINAPVKLSFGTYVLEVKSGSNINREKLAMRLLQERIPAATVKDIIDSCTNTWSKTSATWRSAR